MRICSKFLNVVCLPGNLRGGDAMSTIEFQDECRYNPDRNVVEFEASEDERRLICEIAADALAARLSSDVADEVTFVTAFRRHRPEIQEIAKRLIEAGVITRTGRVLITKPMLES